MMQEEDQVVPPNQSLSPIPLHVGSPPIKPEDRRMLQANAVEAMQVHANEQVDMLRRQAELIMQQAREVEERLKIANEIYKSEIRFTPKIHGTYHLYEKHNGERLLSMIAPNEWGRSCPWEKYIATVKLLGDQTWEVLERGEHELFFD
jgi:hypothetical protein